MIVEMMNKRFIDRWAQNWIGWKKQGLSVQDIQARMKNLTDKEKTEVVRRMFVLKNSTKKGR